MRTSRKRTIAIIVPVTVLALAGIATAANLATTSATLGGGSTLVTNNCAIKVTYDMSVGSTDVTFQAPVPSPPAATATLGGYYLKQVTLTPSGPDCASASFRVTVAKSSGAPLSEAVGSFASSTPGPVGPVKVAVNAFAFDVGAVYATVTTGTASTAGVAP